MDIRYVVDDARARATLQKAPGVVEKWLEGAIARGAMEIARLGRDKAPKLFSTLTNSIRYERLEALHYRVATGVNYARAVEEGTGPAAGHARYYPNPDSLLDYLTTAPSKRGFNWARKGSGKREAQRYDLWWRSRALAWHIYQHGTKAHPYMGPAADEGEPIVRLLARNAVASAIQEAQA